MNPRGEWITHYGAGVGWLPLSWINSSLVTDMAVKTNKASVPVHLWDQRICLPLGVKNNSSLPIIRNFFCRFYRKRLVSSFCGYITLGEVWLSWITQEVNPKRYLWIVRGQLKSSIRGLMTMKIMGHNDKESELASVLFVEQESESEIPIRLTSVIIKQNLELATSIPNDKYLLDSSFPPIPNKAPDPVGNISELNKDVSVAAQAILQYYLNGTWWLWDAGSGLLFWRMRTKQSWITARDGFKVYVSGKLPHFK